MNANEEELWIKFTKDHTGRCCDCQRSIPHKSIRNYYPLACTVFKRSGITIPHRPDEVVYCTGFKPRVVRMQERSKP